MKAIMMTIRLWWFYLTYKGIKKAEIRKKFAKNFKGKIFECVSKTNWKKDLMKIPAEEREFFKQFVGKVGLCFECDSVEEIKYHFGYYDMGEWTESYILEISCLGAKELDNYLQASKEYDETKVSRVYGYAIHITNLEIFEKPKEISEFYKVGYEECAKPQGSLREQIIENYNNALKYQLTRAPQSFMFIEV